MLIRRFFAFVVSLFILFSLPLNAANAASSWAITSAVSAGARAIISATKAGYKSAVNISPTAGRMALKVGSRLNTAYTIYAIGQLAGSGVDWVMDAENNRIKFTEKSMLPIYHLGGVTYDQAGIDQVHKDFCGKLATSPIEINELSAVFYLRCAGSTSNKKGTVSYNTAEKYITFQQIAAKIRSNAAAGHAPSKDFVTEIATDMVVSGDFDDDLLSGAVPISDTKPLVPAVPGNGNGNVTHGSDVGTGEDGMSGATPGQQADAAKDAADAAKKAAQAAADAAKDAAEDARQAADAAEDLINSGADTAAIDAAKAAQAAAEKAAADAKAVSDAAVAAANERAAAAERSAEAATQAAQAAAAQAAADLAAAKAAGDAAAIAAAEAAKAAAAAELAVAKEKQAAAEKAAEKAKAEAAKPFELPAFCSWAAPVCDFINWFKEPPPDDESPKNVPYATTGDVGLGDVDRFEKRITFSGQCPSNEFSFSMMGVTYAKPIPYHHLCGFLEQIAPWLLAMCYLGTAYFVVENI